jgi:hypothetical protein
MRPHDPHDRFPRRRRPIVEGLEARDLPSHIALSTVQAPARPAGSGSQSQVAGDKIHDGTAASRGRQASLPNPAVIQQAVNLLYGPNSPTPMTPTPQEIHRETFVAHWTGKYTVGPPRFSDRASTIHFYAVSGGSNQFDKGKFQMVLFPPADPNATPNPGDPYANQVTGVAGLFTKNFLQTGDLLILDLNGAPGPGSGSRSLPTHLSWTYDTDSAALYAAPTGFTQGTGVLDIQYIPDRVPLAGTMGSGQMIVTFQGLINVSQVTNPISKVIM